jgi:ATP-dependent helicase/nuclease subunit B
VPQPYTQSTLITANARLSRQLQRAYDAARGQERLRLWESPDILPRDAWLERVWREFAFRDPMQAPLLLSSLQAEALWEKAIRASDASDVLLDLPATVSAAARAWDLLHAWEAPFDPAEFAEVADPAAFAGWKRTVEQELRENGWITKSQLPRAISEWIEAGALNIPGPLAYTGFDELTPADRRLFETCSVVEWPAAQPFGDPARRREACETSVDELTQAAAWARRKLEAEPAARIGIVVRGLAGQAATVERIFDDVLHPGMEFTPRQTRTAFHVSAGAALIDTPVVAAALLALGLQPGLTLPEAGMLLRSPFLGLSRLAGARLEAGLRGQGVEKVSFQLDAVRRTLPDFAKAVGECPARQRPSQWSVAFSKFLTLAGWPGTQPLSPLEYQALEYWKSLLSDLASLDRVLPRIDYVQALARLRRIARAQRFAASDEDAPVQVMDVLEAAGTRWDALWMAGFHAGVWPESPRPNSFLPLPLQRAAGMPHSSPERELAYARRLTARLLSSAPEVICSYPRHSGEETLRVSPLIEPVPEVSQGAAPPDTVLRRVFAAGVAMEVQPPDQAPPLAAGTLQHGGINVLQDQAACPFRAFAVHRLGAKEAEEADLGLSAIERGTVAHQALESLWTELKTQKELLARPREEIAALVSRYVKKALDGRLRRRHKNPLLDRASDLEQTRWERLLSAWIDEERHRPDFDVIACEESREVEAGGLKLRIKADRIDRLADGTFAILDYKTANNLSVKDWEGERPDAPQLPLYAVKSERAISAVYFAKLAPGDVGTLGHDGPELATRVAGWTAVVDGLGSSFLRGEAAVDPKTPAQTCKYCHLHVLCRIGELGAGAQEQKKPEEEADE